MWLLSTTCHWGTWSPLQMASSSSWHLPHLISKDIKAASQAVGQADQTRLPHGALTAMPNPSKLQRIGAAALWAAQPAVWLLLALGVTAFLLLPLAAKKCYLDEKALLVGGTVPTVRCAWRQLAPAPTPPRLCSPAACPS